MRLVRLRSPGGLENLKFAEEDCSKPRRGELLVRIRACALNFLDDLLVLGKKVHRRAHSAVRRRWRSDRDRRRRQ